MLRPALVALVFPVVILSRRLYAPSENAWYTPRVWWQIMLVSVLFALSGVFLHVGAGLTGDAHLVGSLVCLFIYSALLMYVGPRPHKQADRA